MSDGIDRNSFLSLSSKAEEVGLLLDWLDGILADSDLDQMSAFRFRCAVVEVVNNCIQHAYENKAGRPIELDYRLEPDRVQVSIYDQGSVFGGQPAHFVSEPMAESGRGFEIINAGVSKLQYERKDGWNICRLEQRIDPAGSTPN